VADETGIISATVAAQLLMMTPQRLRQLVNEGYIPKPKAKDKYSLVGCVQGYVRFLKDEKRKGQTVQAESRLKDVRTREVELRIAERENRLIDTEEHEAVLAEILGIINSGLSGFPARITRDMPLRQKIETELDDILRRAADRCDQRCKELRDSGALSETPTEVDA
jgi:hypothetical protein